MVVTVSVAVSLFLLHQPVFSQSAQRSEGKCGDGICDAFEKDRPDICPDDCRGIVACAQEDEMCGGIAGILCCSGLECNYDGNYPDAGGKCKQASTRRLKPKTQEEINEDSPFAIYSPYETFLDRPSSLTRSGINVLLNDLDVKWVQELDRPGDLDTIAESGVNIYSRALPKIGMPRCGKLSSYQEYENTLRETLRKYDNIKYWEADDEPAYIAWGDCPKEYAEFLKVTYRVIKEECGDCKVVFGGLGGDFTMLHENSAKVAYLRKVLEAGGAGYFDIFEFKQNFHTVNEYPALIKNKMKVYGKVLSEYGIDIDAMPLFLETAMYDGSPEDKFRNFPYQTEKEQAVGVISTYIYALSQGIDKIFWMFVVERGTGSIIYAHYGLVHNPDNDGLSHKKLAYFSYKKMVEILEGSDWHNVSSIKEVQNDAYGVFLYRFTRNGKPVYVGWFDCFDEQKCSRMKIDLRADLVFDRHVNAVKITEAVPKYETGKEVTDYRAAFNPVTKALDGGKTTITLKEIPVFVEEVR